MNDTKFYKPKKSLFKKQPKVKNSLEGDSTMKNFDTPVKNKMSNNKNKINGKKFIKKFGIGGGIFVAVLGVIAIIVFIFIVKPAVSVLASVNTLRTDAKDLGDAMAIRDVVLFREILDKTENDLEKLRDSRSKNFGWAEDSSFAGSYYADFDHFVNAGNHAVNAGREFAILIEPFAEAAGLNVGDDFAPEGHSGLADAFASWVSLMPQVAQDMDLVIGEFAAIGDEMKHVNASKYPDYLLGQPIRPLIIGAQVALADADDYGVDIKIALETIPALLGIGTGEQRYAIIMQNDKEIRGTGGFWTNYATFKVSNAKLTSDFSSKDMYSIDFLLDQIDAYHTFPKVPPMYEKYLKVERMYARDANISPDFPTAVDQWMYFYDLGMQVAPWEIKPVKGVIAIDTQVVKELLEVTGPVTVHGVVFDEDNVVLELEKIASLSLSEQSNRKRVLGDLMEGMLINVFESGSNLWPKLIDKGVDLLRRKHAMAFMFDTDVQAILEKYNLAGHIIQDIEGDYVYATQTNLGGDKTNLFVTKEVTHTLEKESGRWARTVDIEYTYNELGGEYAPLVKRFQDWMRLYVPLGSEIISLEGSQDPVGQGEEAGKTYFHGFIALGPGETKTMTFKYFLPEGVVGNTYNLYIQKQSGIDTEIHNVVVKGKTQTFEIDTDLKVSVEL